MPDSDIILEGKNLNKSYVDKGKKLQALKDVSFFLKNGEILGIVGESGSGKKGNTTYNFTNHGSYSGKLVEKEKNIFYYAKNMFLCSAEYVYDDGIKVAPFRAYYSSTSNTSTRAASPLKAFDIIPASLGDINIDGVVTKDDANGILNVILGKEEPKRLQTIMSDVNNDGTITIADVTKLVNMVLQNQAQTEEE